MIALMSHGTRARSQPEGGSGRKSELAASGSGILSVRLAPSFNDSISVVKKKKKKGMHEPCSIHYQSSTLRSSAGRPESALSRK